MTVKACVFWFTGLSGSGKTTIANRVKKLLEYSGYSILVLDGDDVRSSRDTQLGFSEQEIKLNNSLIAELCLENIRKYDVILVPIISPYRESRFKARGVIGSTFYELFISSDIETVVSRDTKGLYKKASTGEINNMIGFSPGAVYEAPSKPDYVIDTNSLDEYHAAKNLYQIIEKCLLLTKEELIP